MTANLLTDADSNLILTGYTGPHQPAIGRALAEQLGRPLVNFEDRLEAHAGQSLASIQDTFGKARLRTLETEVLEEILLYRGAVIRISGQTLASGSNLGRIATTGPVICLVSMLDAVLRRIHLSMGVRFHDPAERDLMLGNLKQAWAARGRDGVHELDVTYLSEAEAVEATLSLFQQLTLSRR